MSKYLDFRPDFSHNILPELLKQNRKFEFIFIDGDHKFDGIFIDYYYAELLLENGGYLLLHDTWMRSTRLVEKFILKNKVNFKHIKTPFRNLSLFIKLEDDQRDGMFFKEFYTFKSLFRHYATMWFNSNKDSWLKRSLIKINKSFRG